MGFLNIALLSGLGLVLIPPIIYWIFQRRVRVVEWAAMRFLLDIMQQRKTRLEELLLLLLRCLLLALLVLAVSRPFLGDTGSGESGSGEVVLVVDASYSMGTTAHLESRFDAARQQVSALLADLGSGTSVMLVLASESPEVVIGEFTPDHGLVRETLRGLKPHDAANDVQVAAMAVKDLLERRARPETPVYWFSDFTQRDWEEHGTSSLTAMADLATLSPVTLMPIFDGITENCTVIDLELPGGVARLGAPATFTGWVHNQGEQEAVDVAVDGLIDGVIVESTVVTVPAGQRASVRFTGEILEPGLHHATLRIRSDNLAADNARHLVFEARDGIPVLAVIGGEAQPRADLFLEYALNPLPGGSEHPEALYHIHRIRPEELLTEDLGMYEVILLVHVPALDRVQADLIEDFVARGGGALFYLGPDTDPAAWNEALHRDGSGLLPWPLAADAPLRQEEADDALELLLTMPGHPLLEGLAEPNLQYFDQVRIYAAHPFAAEASGAAADILAAVSVTGGERYPLLVARPWQRGRSVFFGSSADLSHANLAVRPVFVALSTRSMGWLREPRTGRRLLRVGDAPRREMDLATSQATFRLIDPAGGEQVISVLEREGAFRLELPPLEYAGIYQLINQDMPDERDLLAVAVDPSEGAVAGMGLPALSRVVADSDITVSGDESGDELLRGGMRELAWLLLPLLLILLACENALAYRISRR